MNNIEWNEFASQQEKIMYKASKYIYSSSTIMALLYFIIPNIIFFTKKEMSLEEDWPTPLRV
jgi:hypothetical protein